MRPYKFSPILKSTLWGGQRIAQFKGIDDATLATLLPTEISEETGLPIGSRHVGESWEISAVPGSESTVCWGGPEDDSDLGLTLPQLIERHKGKLVGQHVYARYGNQFPLLIKFIDARRDLSMQVHPNDSVAFERHGCMGKTEMWYIIDAEPGALIYSGMAKQIDADELVRLAHLPLPEGENPFADVVAASESQPGDIYYLPAGRIHAIGAGNFLAEIQQSSDITYRVCDYGRLDRYTGKPRALHIQEAKDVIDYSVHPTYKSYYDPAAPVADLAACAYFRTFRIRLEGRLDIDYDADSFVVVMCMEGEATLNGIPVRHGDTLLVPACDNVMHLQGEAILLTAII